MKLLLDTHTLLWSIGKSNELPQGLINELENNMNEIVISAVSLWEIALKYRVGKLSIESFDIREIPKYCKKMGFELIPLDPVEALNSLHLPLKENHKDPFDRMLIYQCIQNKYTLASKDPRLNLYKDDGLKYIW
ncbi:MAG: type II toxin-antitoxin system VapC family toxin [Spirochaetaceae bacterium]|jgi:PIN domain nuclease of toxin-antitoxin system|nr:type II toxin-antitoxin system VapC family toxin [Spirochaetaceae bacterium]